MFDLNGSDTSWLVYADYLEDQGIDATHIRELEPITNQWHSHFNSKAVIGDSFFCGVGVHWHYRMGSIDSSSHSGVGVVYHFSQVGVGLTLWNGGVSGNECPVSLERF